MEQVVKLAIVLFNLGGPDSPDAVEPFLQNLFSDPAILSVPALMRRPLARWIAARRAPIAREIYAKLGGASPILNETEAQADALDRLLKTRGIESRSFIAMRCWHPFSDAAAKAVRDWGAEAVVLLPLYPQFSTTTTASSFADWNRVARTAGLSLPTTRICCYPDQPGFIAAQAAFIQAAFTRAKPDVSYRLLLSAHGLPKRTVARGDPYPWQVERTAAAIVDRLAMPGLDAVICYQSRVGPLQWIGPATDSEIQRAGRDGKGVIVVPIAFVSEHSETLVELDIEYAHLAERVGVPHYLRVPTVSKHPDFIAALADLLLEAAGMQSTVSGAGGRLCPAGFRACPWGRT
jgi:ferrochelatase